MAAAIALAPPFGFDELPIDEQVAYVQSLWERIACRPKEVPVPAWHRAEIEARLADHESDPHAGEPWEDVEKELRAALRK